MYIYAFMAISPIFNLNTDHSWQLTYVDDKQLSYGGGSTNRDGHHDGWVVGRGGQIPLSENALSGWVF